LLQSEKRATISWMIVRGGLRNGVLGFVVFFVLASAAPRRAASQEDARAYNQKATAAFALGKYAAAADYFEKAFELKPDPALLYNAAQAHRMAGDKERALALYQNYVRVYGGSPGQRADVEKHIEELKKAIEHDKEVATSPPTNTEPISPAAAAETAPPPVAPVGVATTAPPAAVPTAPGPVTLVDQPKSEAGDHGSLTSNPWFWVAVGGGAAVVAAILIVALSGGSKDPSPSIGVVP
jgi:tetratricopeptide (TPR) repeat protein